MEDNKFDALGIEFKILTSDLIPTVCDFMEKHFMPDEPIFRSLGIQRHWIVDDFFFADAVNGGLSLGAFDKEGELLGVRLAKKQKRSDWVSWAVDKLLNFYFGRMPEIFIPESLRNVAPFLKLCEICEYDTFKMVDKLNVDVIYEAKALCSARFHGVKGLGTELVKRAETLAIENGCQYTYVLATGNYSQHVFRKQGYQQLKSLVYDEFRNEEGELYLKDTREHIQCVTFIKTLVN